SSAPGNLEFVVGFVKTYLFIVLVDKTLDNSDAQQAVFHFCVHVCDSFPLFSKGRLHLAPPSIGVPDNAGNKGEDKQSQRHVNRHQVNKRPNQHHRCDKQILRAVMGELCYLPQIIDDPGHQVSDLCVVKELEIQCLQM